MNDHDLWELCRVYLICWYPLISFFRITWIIWFLTFLMNHIRTRWNSQLWGTETPSNVVTHFRRTVKERSLYGVNSIHLRLLSLYTERGHLRRVCVFFLKAITDHTLLCWRWWAQLRVKIYLACTILHPVVGLHYFLLPFTVRWETMMKQQEKQLWQVEVGLIHADDECAKNRRSPNVFIQVLPALMLADTQRNIELTDFFMDFDVLFSLNKDDR